MVAMVDAAHRFDNWGKAALVFLLSAAAQQLIAGLLVGLAGYAPAKGALHV